MTRRQGPEASVERARSERARELAPRPVSFSHSELSRIVMHRHINGEGRLFGGQLMQWIDEMGGLVARRHAQRSVITAAVDNLQFRRAVYINDILVLVGRVTYVGRSSMEVRVDTYVEGEDGLRSLINRAFLVMVAVDEAQRPVAVPPLLIENEIQQAEWDNGRRRSELRRRRRREGF